MGNEEECVVCFDIWTQTFEFDRRFDFFQIPRIKQPYRIIKKYRDKISYINRMIPCLEKKLDEIILLLMEINK